MDLASFYSSEIFTLVIIPLLIFLARICDVTLDTARIIYVSRGMKLLATLIGFFGVLIWLVSITQIIQNLTNIIYYFAYAGGFAMGNYIGIYVEERMAIGTVIIRIITQKDATNLVEHLKEEGYGVTYIDAKGSMGPVKVVFSIIKRKDIDQVLKIIRKFNPLSFYTVEDVRSFREGVFRKKPKKPFIPKIKRKHKSKENSQEKD
ncbi:MAG TPA: DUF2179 domain-containing protein [Deltaproteobacteria bacterium]|mgnify:CR=1 FL=1|nr:DUF2179 domain-containing protein [Deltaproteobacteria bacterium]